MLKEVGKVAVCLVTSVVAVPYTVALLANMLYGWPQCEHKFRRAFNPRKVYALNYVVLQQLTNVRYLRLYLRWKQFYNNASHTRLIKDIPYGSNENNLDLYFPRGPVAGGEEGSGPYPVVVFIYGGAWGSGDKNMYSLLGAQLADNLQAIVCCPNYSTYPKGYVDDMVQDIVDVLYWLHSNVHTFNGDKDRVMLLGHSAGAHLAVMATLELTMKRLLHNPQALILPDIVSHSTPPTLSYHEQIQFHEEHFDGNSQDSQDNNGAELPPYLSQVSTTSSFYMVDPDNGAKESGQLSLKSSGASESFYVVKKNNGESDSTVVDTPEKKIEQSDRSDDKASEVEEKMNKEQQEESGKEGLTEQQEESKAEQEEEAKEEQEEGKESREEEKEVCVEKSPAAVQDDPEETLAKELAKAKSQIELIIEDDDLMTQAQKDVRDILNSVKCVIGLAGVYDITDHFMHESFRGIEDVSSMAKAMYGEEHFDRFSPTHIVSNLPRRTSLPPLTLVHGTTDLTVPVSSTETFAEILQEMGGAHVSRILVPGCSHIDVCLDLMDPSRTFYDILMDIIRRETITYL